jgi:hypothetical protein
VGAACTADRITVTGAAPSPGWRIQVRDTGPEEVDVVFTRDDDGGEVEVHAACVDGQPRFEVADETGDTGDEGDEHPGSARPVGASH